MKPASKAQTSSARAAASTGMSKPQGTVALRTMPSPSSYRDPAMRSQYPASIPRGPAPWKKALHGAGVTAAGYLNHISAQPRGKYGNKKKGSAFGNFLRGAARVAASIIPDLLPVLLANNGHAPSIAAAQMAGFQAHGLGPAAAQVGLAQPASIMPMCGLSGLMGINKGGKLAGVRFSGLEYIGPFNADGQSYAAGDVVAEFDLNPMSATFLGTRLQQFAALYERFKFKKLVILYEPSCATTTNGALGMYIDTDPDDVIIQGTPTRIIQNASGHMGYEQNQVWGVGCSGYYPDKNTQDFYLDADGSDERLISPGTANVIAINDVDDTATGSFYMAYVAEMMLPQIDDGAALNGGWFSFYSPTDAIATGANYLNIFGLQDGFVPGTSGGILSTYAALEYDGLGTWLTGLPAGTYLCCAQYMLNNDADNASAIDVNVTADVTAGAFPVAAGAFAASSFYTSTAGTGVTLNALGYCQTFSVITIPTRGVGAARFSVGAVQFAMNVDTWDPLEGVGTQATLVVIKLGDVPTGTSLGDKRRSLQDVEATLESESKRVSEQMTRQAAELAAVKSTLARAFPSLGIDTPSKPVAASSDGHLALLQRIAARDEKRKDKERTAASAAASPLSSFST